jgi:hypothetical protein
VSSRAPDLIARAPAVHPEGTSSAALRRGRGDVPLARPQAHAPGRAVIDRHLQELDEAVARWRQVPNGGELVLEWVGTTRRRTRVGR